MRYIFFFLFIFLSTSSFSQSVISSAGNESSSSSYNISWTLGETVIATLEGTNISLTQGFHQPVVIDNVPTFLEEEMVLDMVAYPNPAYDKVLFKGGKDDVVYHLRLVDKLGRVLEQKSVPKKNLEVEMSKYTNGSYLIEVIENDSQKRVLFNIIKSTK